jgi:hypothetical protein
MNWRIYLESLMEHIFSELIFSHLAAFKSWHRYPSLESLVQEPFGILWLFDFLPLSISRKRHTWEPGNLVMAL